MNNLGDLILNRIKKDGPISFRDFMSSALYERGLGYYTREEIEIGKAGDFYTSPHAHKMFGSMLGRQAMECWQHMGEPETFEILEVGGGRGWLAKDILDYLRDKPIYKHLSYTLVELNPAMASRQRDLLKEHLNIIRWIDDVKQCGNISGLILSNELIDAFPVQLIELSGGKWLEAHVDVSDGALSETLLPIKSEELDAYINKYIHAGNEDGYRTEVNLEARQWLTSVTDILREGFILTIDYGYPAYDYYAPERKSGTLLCYWQHKTTEDYLVRIGQQDITAHINFTDMKKHGDSLGLSTIGYARQGIYLVSLGFDEVIAELYGKTPNMGDEARKMQNLIMPGTMGDTHKVLVQYKGANMPNLRGFAMKNEIAKLD